MEEASLGSIIIKYLLAFLMIIIILISVLGMYLVKGYLMSGYWMMGRMKNEKNQTN